MLPPTNYISDIIVARSKIKSRLIFSLATNYSQKPYNFQVLVLAIVAFLLGIALSTTMVDAHQIALWLILAFVSIGIIFSRERIIWTLALVIIFFVVGLVYPLWLGREQLITLPNNFFVVQFLEGVRIKFSHILNAILPYPHSELASGLLVGVQDGFPRELKQMFITTGTIHIVAVSGFNVTLIIKIFADWARGWGRSAPFYLGTILIVAFIILTGGQASVVRAGVMGWMFLLAGFLYRQPYMLGALLLSAFFMVAEEPLILTQDIGFQLSFGAMVGLIYLSPIIRQEVERLWGLKFQPKILQSILTETLSAQIAVAPLLIYHFERISILSPIPNLLILWVLIAPMSLSFFAGVLGWIYLPLGKLIALPLAYFLDYILRVVQIFSQVPGMQAHITLDLEGVIFSYIVMLIIVLLLKKTRSQQNITILQTP